jgi:undecaprenyl-diphosphatase
VLELDRDVAEWIVAHRVGWLDWLFEALSYVGTWGAVFLAVALALAVARRRPELVVLVAAADLLADGLTEAIKQLAGRHRPHLHPLLHAAGLSFPSGHAATAFACATAIAYAAPRLAAPVYLLAVAIAFSRVYNGVHYPLDVLAGAALGAVVATALLLLAGDRRRSLRSPRAG